MASPSAEVPQSIIDDIIGPVALSVCFNAFLYGFAFVQFWHYQASEGKDNILNRCLVGWVALVDTTHTASTVYMLWYYVVANFTNPGVVGTIPWPLTAQPIFIVLASCPTQIYFAWRIQQFSKSWIFFWIAFILSLISTGFGFAGGVLAFTESNINGLSKIAYIADIWLGLATACDGFIALVLLFYFQKQRVGFKNTDGILIRVIHFAVESTALNALMCICDLIVFNARKSTNWDLLFALPLGRIYTNTLLALLNSRLAMLNPETEEIRFPSGRSTIGRRVEHHFTVTKHYESREAARDMKVGIERTLQVEVDPYVRPSSRSSGKDASNNSDKEYSMNADVDERKTTPMVE